MATASKLDKQKILNHHLESIRSLDAEEFLALPKLVIVGAKQTSMTEEDKDAVQGRAYRNLKRAKSEVATLRAFFLEYARTAADVKHMIELFLADPAATGQDGVSMADHVKASYRSLTSNAFEDHADALAEQVKLLRELEDQINNF